MDHLDRAADFLLANPIFLVPLLLIVAVGVFAVLKRFFKLLAIMAIAAVLYVLLAEHFGGGVPELGLL